MKPERATFLLVALAILVILIAGCTASKSVTVSTGTPAETTPAASASIAPATTACPDANEKGVWGYTWDSREVGYASNHDVRDLLNGKEGEPDSWTGINAPDASEVKLTQKCRDVTGTVSFSTNPVCIADLSGTIDGSQLTGTWKSACEAEDGDTSGTFSVNMYADNKTWLGKFIATKDQTFCTDCPPNWAAKRVG